MRANSATKIYAWVAEVSGVSKANINKQSDYDMMRFSVIDRIRDIVCESDGFPPCVISLVVLDGE